MKINKKTGIMIGILVLLVLIGGWRNLRTGIFVQDKFFVQKDEDYYKSGDDEIRMIRGDGFTNFQMVLNGEERTAGLVWSKSDRLYNVEHDYAEITFDDGEVIRGTWFANDMLVDDTGMPIVYLNYPLVRVSVGDVPEPISNAALSNILCRLDLRMIEKNGSVGFIILGALIYGLGMLTFLYPEKMFFLGSRWQFRNPELSDDGILMQQFSGVVCMIVGFVIALNLPGLR